MSICSGIPIAIGGTDLNPAVFYGDFVVAIANVAGPWGTSKTQKWIELWRNAGKSALGLWVFQKFRVFFWMVLGVVVCVSSCIGGI